MVTASREFQIFTKPIGAICNLDCHYCYYLKKEYLYPESKSFRMPDDLLEEYIVQHIAASPEGPISFAWHGGEPTLLGLDYFRTIVALQRKHQPPGRRISNGMQTNGTLLNEAWCSFLAAEGFAIGLSLDGPEDVHDAYRVNKGQQPTHKQVMRGYKLLRQHKIPCDVLCVVHAENVRYPIPVYRFFKDIKADYIGFLPLVERQPAAAGGVSDRTVPAEALGTFLCTIFDEWVRNDIGQIMVQLFEEAARTARGQEHALCIFRRTCGQVPVLEHNGDFYSCDHFVEPEYHLGNIRSTPLVELLDSPQQHAFGQAKLDTLPRYCQECEVRAMCNGGCPKDRIIQTPDGEPGLNYLCAGWKRFFTYSRPYLAQMVALERAGQSPAQLMQLVRATDARNRATVGRNDPCPCGSGRKYKRCCLNK